MYKLLHRFFDSYRVREKTNKVVYIGKNEVGVIDFYPSDDNPFMDDRGEVRLYDNGDIWCDEFLATMLKYTGTYKEFMDFCMDIWKNKTNQKIYPNYLKLGGFGNFDQSIPYRDSKPKDYLVE